MSLRCWGRCAEMASHFVRATPEHEACYQELIAVIRKWADQNPSVQNKDILAMLGRAAGYCVAMCLPNERLRARDIAIKNMDAGIRAVRSI